MADQVVDQIDVLLRLIDEAWKVRALTAEYQLETERLRVSEMRLQIEKLFEKIRQFEASPHERRYADIIGMTPEYRSPKRPVWFTTL